MRFELLERDGLARIGVLDIDGIQHTTPAIAYVDTPRYPPPSKCLKLESIWHSEKGSLVVAPSEFAADATKLETKAHLFPRFRGSPFAKEEGKSALVVLDNISGLLLDSKKFVASVEDIKKGGDLLSPAYCSVAGLVHRLAFLTYCGFDVIDSIPLVMATENGVYLTSSGMLTYGRMRELPCSCPSCSSGRRSREELLRHNYAAAENELKLVRHAILEGTLRELVEARIRSDPWLVQNLRLLDLEHYDLQEMHAPVKGSPFHAGSKESLSRPDVLRWRKRIELRYARPGCAKVLVLIPCSARKPYSISQSHFRFRQAIAASGKYDIVHEVIVTSPLGLVPRELELFYPAQDYDIPVTGHWDRDEKKMVEEMVQWLVQSQKYELIISHLGDEREPVNSVLEDFVDTSNGNPGSRDSLRKLEEALRKDAPEPDRESSKARDLDEMRALCRFQFGVPGEALCEKASIAGRWPNLRIIRDGAQLGMLTGSRGMISITMEGARVIAATGAYCVEIDDFIPKGNLFAVGIEGADKDIRIGDDVAVACKREPRAVGVARMCAAEMEAAERGEAVHIRHSL